MAKNETRDQIVEQADLLFYQQGFEGTSFADIAGAVKISRGNFYHHFKSKDDILSAVIERRLTKTQAMLGLWEEEGKDPLDRIRRFIQILIVNQSKIMLYGCPVGTLTSELGKLNHSSQAEANKIFSLFQNWLSGQFEKLGCGHQSQKYAQHLLARSQGVATLAQAFQDEAFVQKEVEQMCDWAASRV